jgi:hypothetical protein
LKLSALQIEVFNNNLKPALQLAELLYEESVHKGKKYIALDKRQDALNRLVIHSDDMKGVFFSNT